MAVYNRTTRTYDLRTADRVIRDVFGEIAEPDIDSTPFLALLNMKDKTTTSQEFETFSRPSGLRYAKINGAITNGSTTLTLDSTGMLVPGDVLVNPLTFENMQVVTVDSTTQVTVLRGASLGGSTVNIADDQLLWCMGVAAAEGGSRVGVTAEQPTASTNYTQIFKTGIQLTRNAVDTAIYSSRDEMEEMKIRKLREHQREIEMRFLFGTKHKATNTENYTYYTQGIIPALGGGTNESGTLTKAEFDSYCAPVFTYGSNSGSRIAFCNMYFLQVFNKLATLNHTVLTNDPADKDTWGWGFTNYKSYFGTVKFKEHRLLTRMYPSVGCYLLLDPEYITKRTFTGGATKFSLVPPKADSTLLDAWTGEYQTECGVQIQMTTSGQSAHDFRYGITAAAADA